MAAIIGSGISPSSYTTAVVPDECKESSIKSSFCIENGKICYETDEQRTQVIESVATRISNFYGTFLQKDWHLERVKAASHTYNKLIFEASHTYKGLTFMYPDQLPSEEFPCLEKIQNFIDSLKKAIITGLNQRSIYVDFNCLELITNYIPEALLSKVLDDSEIGMLGSLRMELFPIESCVEIIHSVKEKQIEVRASF